MCWLLLWARISKVYFGANRMDAEAVGFDDNHIYEYIRGQPGKIPPGFRSDRV